MPITRGDGIVINIDANDTASPKIDRVAQEMAVLHQQTQKIIAQAEISNKEYDKFSQKMNGVVKEEERLARQTQVLDSIQFRFNQTMEFGRNILNAAKTVYTQTVGEIVNYASSVRELSLISGQSAESTSRLIQVADDYKISSQDLTTAQRKLATEGLSLSIETIAKLSDEYLKLNTGAERQAFLTEHLGRASSQYAELLSQGSAAIMARNAAVEDGLILDDAALKRARDYEFALDDLEDSVTALKMSIGNKAIPILVELITKITASTGDSGSLLGREINYILQTFGEASGELTKMDVSLGWGKYGPEIQTLSGYTDKYVLALARARKEMHELYPLMDMNHEAIKELAIEYYNAISTQDNINAGYQQMALALVDISPAAGAAAKSVEELAAAEEEVRKGIVDRTAFELAFTGAKTAADTAQVAMKMMGTEIQGLGAEGALVWNGFLVATGQISSEAAAQFAKVYTIVEEAKRLLGLGVPIKFVVEYMVNASGGGTFSAPTTAAPPGGYTVTDTGGTTWYVDDKGWSTKGYKSGGGSFAGWAMVGDSPGGGRTPYTEYVYAPQGAVVYNQAQMSGRTAPPSAAVGGIIPPDSGMNDSDLREFSRYIVEEFRKVVG